MSTTGWNPTVGFKNTRETCAHLTQFIGHLVQIENPSLFIVCGGLNSIRVETVAENSNVKFTFEGGDHAILHDVLPGETTKGGLAQELLDIDGVSSKIQAL